MTVRYTRETLTAAVRASTTLSEAITRLGRAPTSGRRRYVRELLERWDIDVSHFEREGVRHTEQHLRELVRESSSVAEVVRRLGIAPVGGNHAHISRRIAALGIDTSHFTAPHSGRGAVIGRQALQAAVAESSSLAAFIRILELPLTSASRNRVRKAIGEYGIPTAHFTGQGHNRNRPAPNRRTADEILQRLDQGASRTKRSLLHRALQEKGVAYICGECGVGSLWHGRRLVLEIGHINGDRLDNRIGNLRYLCPSCHSQTCTFSNRSRA